MKQEENLKKKSSYGDTKFRPVKKGDKEISPKSELKSKKKSYFPTSDGAMII